MWPLVAGHQATPTVFRSDRREAGEAQRTCCCLRLAVIPRRALKANPTGGEGKVHGQVRQHTIGPRRFSGWRLRTTQRPTSNDSQGVRFRGRLELRSAISTSCRFLSVFSDASPSFKVICAIDLVRRRRCHRRPTMIKGKIATRKITTAEFHDVGSANGGIWRSLCQSGSPASSMVSLIRASRVKPSNVMSM